MVHWLLPQRRKSVTVICAFLAMQLNFILELGSCFRQNPSYEIHAIWIGFLIRRINHKHGHLSLVIMAEDRD